MEDTLQKLYDSEINACIWWNWDGGVEVRLGNGLYGDDKNWEVRDNVPTIAEAEAWLIAKARELYPDSTFVKNLLSYEAPFFDGLNESLDKLTIRPTTPNN